MSARYLLRLDDACPTMSGANWGRLEALFDDLAIKPIVAVIPDNRDPQFYHDPPDPKFWNRVRSWQARGWTIGLHGYQHVLRPSRAKQVIPLYPWSEFAGRTLAEQAEMIRSGWNILVSHGLTPTVWVAPSHSFDATTVRALASETPIRAISDGLARDCYFEGGFTWIPQQLWSLTLKKAGVWTVCLHPNTMSDIDFQRLEKELRGDYSGRIAALQDLPAKPRQRSLGDRVEAANFWRRHYFQRGVGLVKGLVGR